MSEDRPRIIEVDFRHDPNADKPTLTVKRRTYSDCDHLFGQKVDEATRTVTCGECGAVLDPIEVLIGWAKHWERYADAIKSIRHEHQEQRDHLADILKRIKRERARLRRMGAEVPPQPYHRDHAYALPHRWVVNKP